MPKNIFNLLSGQNWLGIGHSFQKLKTARLFFLIIGLSFVKFYKAAFENSIRSDKELELKLLEIIQD